MRTYIIRGIIVEKGYGIKTRNLSRQGKSDTKNDSLERLN